MLEVTVADMTPQEFKTMIGDLIDQKLADILGDPDDGLVMREAYRDRLIRQKKAVAKGERGKPFDAVKKRLGIA